MRSRNQASCWILRCCGPANAHPHTGSRKNASASVAAIPSVSSERAMRTAFLTPALSLKIRSRHCSAPIRCDLGGLLDGRERRSPPGACMHACVRACAGGCLPSPGQAHPDPEPSPSDKGCAGILSPRGV
jgi:hypothetical protein